MTIQYTSWSPDTCECIIVYSWDDTESAETRKHKLHSVENKCEAHKHTPHDNAHFETVLEENQRKNIVHQQINNGEHAITWRWDGKSPHRTLVVHDGVKESRHDKK